MHSMFGLWFPYLRRGFEALKTCWNSKLSIIKLLLHSLADLTVFMWFPIQYD